MRGQEVMGGVIMRRIPGHDIKLLKPLARGARARMHEAVVAYARTRPYAQTS